MEVKRNVQTKGVPSGSARLDEAFLGCWIACVLQAKLT
jgi:hypothetical protein